MLQPLLKQLFLSTKAKLLPGIRLKIPAELNNRQHRCRTGLKWRVLKWKFITISSLDCYGKFKIPGIYKEDENEGLTRTQWEYCKCSIMSSTKTWLQEDMVESKASLPRLYTTSRKKRPNQQIHIAFFSFWLFSSASTSSGRWFILVVKLSSCLFVTTTCFHFRFGRDFFYHDTRFVFCFFY